MSKPIPRPIVWASMVIVCVFLLWMVVGIVDFAYGGSDRRVKEYLLADNVLNEIGIGSMCEYRKGTGGSIFGGVSHGPYFSCLTKDWLNLEENMAEVEKMDKILLANGWINSDPRFVDQVRRTYIKGDLSISIELFPWAGEHNGTQKQLLFKYLKIVKYDE